MRWNHVQIWFSPTPASVHRSPPPADPPPLNDRLAGSGFTRISMRMAAVGERVKPGDEATKSSPNFLPGGGVGEAGRRNKDARGRSGDSGFTICTCGLKSPGQCASDTANYERPIHPLSLWRDVGESGGDWKGGGGGRGKWIFKEGKDKKVNNRALNRSRHYRQPPPFTLTHHIFPSRQDTHVLSVMFTFVRVSSERRQAELTAPPGKTLWKWKGSLLVAGWPTPFLFL